MEVYPMGVVETPPEEALRLAAFKGEWDVTGNMSDGTDRFPVTGHWVFARAIDGWGVMGTMVTGIEGMGSFEESELIGLDSESGRVHLFSMNKWTIRDHVGGWESDDRLVTRFFADDDGTAILEEIAITFHDSNRMDATVVEKVAGRTVLTTDLSLRRHP